MMQKQSDGHIFVPDTEIADAEFQCKVTANDLLLDLKVLMKEYYTKSYPAQTKTFDFNIDSKNCRL